MNSLDFVSELINGPTIASICLFRPIMTPPIQQTPNLSEGERTLVTEALAIREKLRFPFWDCLMGLIAARSDPYSNLLALASRHNPQESTFEIVSVRDVSPSALATRIAQLPQGQVLALSSKVFCPNGAVLHIPMLDFHCEASPVNDKLAVSIMEKLEMTGYLAHSGQSYHFYGTTLLSEEKMVCFLAKALLFAPIVDRAWIAHQIIEKACGLRISPGKNYERCPQIFARI